MPGPQRVSIAVLMTCHNRVCATLAALRSLSTQAGLDQDFVIDVHLVDAGSSDGTREAVRAEFPAVDVIPAGSDTFWGGGMAMAAAAAGVSHDFQLWLNDDVVLDLDAVQRLLHVAGNHPRAVVVGAARDSAGGRTYGGFTRGPRPLQFVPVGIADEVTPCDTMNGNVVLVPRAVTEQLGAVDAAFPHTMGDIDFGLRATAGGFPILQAPGALGVCEQNSPAALARRPRQRLSQVASVKRLPPRAWWRFCRRHSGAWAPVYFVKPYVESLVSPER